MGIVVAHDPDFRLTGRVAYETGVGEQSTRNEQMARQEAQQAAQRELERERMAMEVQSQQRTFDQQVAMSQLQHQQQLETNAANTQNAIEEHKAFGQIDSDKELNLDKSRYTLAQQRKIEDLQQKCDWVDSQDWKPEEKQQAKQQLQWEYATGQSKSPWAVESAQDLASKSTFIDERGHRMHVNSQTGEVKDLDDSASKEHSNFVQKTFTDILKIQKSSEDASPRYTPEQAMQIANQMGMAYYPQFYPDIAKRQRTIRAVMENPQDFLKTMAGDIMKPGPYGVGQVIDPNKLADLKAMQTLFELGDEKRIAMVLERMGIIKPMPKAVSLQIN
jgi:hypothetical protein